MKLSIIMPFCNEYPQSAFTAQTVLNEFNNVDFELIMVNNFTEEVENQKNGKNSETFCPNCMQTFTMYRKEDLGFKYLTDRAAGNNKLKVLSYTKKLSHWNSKNFGVANSTGDILLFLDAHVVPSPLTLEKAVKYYYENLQEIGTLHLPLSYLLSKKDKRLIYKLETNPEKGFYHYQFSGYRKSETPYEVAVMSTCGMIMSKSIFEYINGWPEEMGIYGGGENYINFTLAILGFKKFIYPTDPLFHFVPPEGRGYNWNYDDFIRNRCIATYMSAGEDAAHKFVMNCQGNSTILERIFQDAISKTVHHRKLIENCQKKTITEWLAEMKEKNLWDGKFSNKEWVN